MVQIIVPTATKGVNIVRGIGVWGRAESDHCEVKYENVRVPVANALGRVGEGHQAAQDRLGAGRIFHCMNSIGQMWRAFDLMVERADDPRGARRAAGRQAVHPGRHRRQLHRHPDRPPVHHPRRREDRPGPAGGAHRHLGDQGLRARPRTPGWSTGPSRSGALPACRNDLPLWGMYQGARTLRIADGPDEVHKILIAKNVLGQYAKGEGWDFGN